MKKRVGIVTPGFSASETDWCIPALLDLVRWLSRDYEVTVHTLRYPGGARTYEVYGAKVIAIGGGTAGRLGRLRVWSQALQVIFSQQFDVLHAIWAHEPGFLATLAGQVRRTPVIVSLFGGELVNIKPVRYGSQRNPLERALIHFAIRCATLVTVGSHTLAERARPLVGDRLRVTPIGVATDRFRPAGSTMSLAGEFPIVQAGSLVPIKDQLTLLDALRRLNDTRLHLHLAGDGPLRPQLEALAGNLDVPVTFHGDIDHGQLPSLYRGAKLHVVSSRYESQNMAALEAAACGIAGAGTAVGVLPELGLPTSPPGDSTALAEIIRRSTILPTIGKVSEDRLAPYTLDRAASAFAALYEEITG